MSPVSAAPPSWLSRGKASIPLPPPPVLGVSDGLACFAAVTGAGCSHAIVKTGSGPKAAKTPAFTLRWLLPSLASRSEPLASWRGWVNTALGNLEAAITGTYRSISAKHVPRYLAASTADTTSGP